MRAFRLPPRSRALTLLWTTAVAATAICDDQPQWGVLHSRNMVSEETGLPASFDPETGENIRWVVPLGTETNSSPVVARGCVLVGTNHAMPRDPRHTGHRGVLLCLDEATGKLRWQLIVPRLEDRKYLDWRQGGICSTSTVEGDRVYLVTNRADVVCLDLDGQADGNDGPCRDEGRLMAPAGEPPVEVTAIDADIVWIYDMKKELGVHPHDSTHSSILIDGPHLYVNTSNGIDRTHHTIPSPDAPSLIVLEKQSGRLVARDGEHIGPRIFHCTWSSPSLGVVDGERRVFFCGGDGVCYGFTPLEATPPPGTVRTLERRWRFDCDPDAPKENVQSYVRNRDVSPSTIMGMPVFHEGRLYVAGGGDIWWGKREAWIQCIDPRKSGDTKTEALIWSRAVDNHCTSTPAVHDGLVYVTDHGRYIRCLDARTGEVQWSDRLRGSMFGSALVADGKVYVGSKGRELRVYAASREKKVLATISLGSPMIATPVAANGTLYIASMKQLFAVRREPAAGSDAPASAPTESAR